MKTKQNVSVKFLVKVLRWRRRRVRKNAKHYKYHDIIRDSSETAAAQICTSQSILNPRGVQSKTIIREASDWSRLTFWPIKCLRQGHIL